MQVPGYRCKSHYFWSSHFKWLYLAIKWEHSQSSQLNSGLIRSDRMNVSFFRDRASKWCSKSISELFNSCFNEEQLTYLQTFLGLVISKVYIFIYFTLHTYHTLLLLEYIHFIVCYYYLNLLTKKITVYFELSHLSICKINLINHFQASELKQNIILNANIIK